MILHSTNGVSPKVSFAQGIANGLAPDRGLYMPDSLPTLPRAFYRNIGEMSLRDVGYVVANTLFGDMVSSTKLKAIVDESLNFDIPLRHVAGNRYVLDLFNGPTFSFKDVGARFMARLMPELAWTDSHRERNIILATSGDSGGAIANAFSRSANTNVYILFPKGDLTPEQVAQFATLRHVIAVEVDGTFDDCQNLVMEALRADAAKGENRLTAGNSINPARELPSVIYYFHAYARAVAAAGNDAKVVISVPCGNLGSLAAALMAKRMGLPVERFFAANNANDVFVEYLKTGGFKPQRALETLARAMDVGNPSNIARIIDLYQGDLPRLRRDVEGYAYGDDEIAATMRETLELTGMHIDPQGAIALRAINRHLRPDETGVALASAHPAKFAAAAMKATGTVPQRPQNMQRPMGLPMRIFHIPPTHGALHRIMKQ